MAEMETPNEFGGRAFFGVRPRNIFEAIAMDLVDKVPVIGTVTALKRAEKRRMFGDDIGAALSVLDAVPIVNLFVYPNLYEYLSETGMLPKFGKIPTPEEMMKKMTGGR